MALKKTSRPFEISAVVTESAANTFTEEQIEIQLNPLDNEVLLVHSVDLQIDSPNAVPNTNTAVSAALTRSTKTALARIDDSDVLASSNKEIIADGFAGSGVGFDNRSQADTPPAELPYVGIVATSNMFLQVIGNNNTSAKSARVRVYCTRATADAATYAALVQSELLSA